MEETFVLTVDHNGKQLNLDTQFMRVGYTYKFKVQVNGMEVFFEPDEQGEFRAILPEGIDERNKRNIDLLLLQNIADTIKGALS
jgi:hypothetical protein